MTQHEDRFHRAQPVRILGDRNKNPGQKKSHLLSLYLILFYSKPKPYVSALCIVLLGQVAIFQPDKYDFYNKHPLEGLSMVKQVI